MSDYRCSSCGRELPPGKCPKCNVYHDDLRPDGPLETCPASSHEANGEAIRLLRMWLDRLDYSDPHGDKPMVAGYLSRYAPDSESKNPLFKGEVGSNGLVGRYDKHSE